jgi:hypothetical protein
MSCYGFSCLKEERFLRRFGAILVSKVFGGGGPGQNWPDQFAKPI